MLRFNGEGQMRKDPGNAALLLANLPEWKGAIRYDEFSGKTRWARPAPLIDGMARPVVGEELKDTHVIYVGHWLSRFSRVTFTRETVRDAIESAALSHRYNPLQEYLESLAWDRKPRVGVWLSTYLGCEDSEYTRIVGRWWLISAVARAMKPGCQADCVLVLKGPQGARKSSAVIALAGDQWVLESLPKLNDKDSVQILRGVWIAAMNELESIRGTALTRVKDYISTRVDKFRASYGRYTIDVPRACVFVGTANEQYCLPYDPTGLRRWWPVDVGAIDTDAIERDRDQIWAEAMAYYRAGEHWWPESMGHLDLLHEQQQSSVDSDPWESVIGDWLAHREEILEPGDTLHVTTTHVLQSCLGVTPDRMTRADQTRAGGILRGLGYESQRVRTGSGNREYQYSRVSG
jgi:putative DNA primase/helicase